MIYGLAAALGFGLSDLGAAVVSRRIGAWATVAISQVAAVVALLILLLSQQPVVEMSASDAVLLVINGIVAAAAYLAFYRALELGPVALVDPIASAYPAVTVTLSAALIEEQLGGPALWGVVVTIFGVILSSTRVTWSSLRRMRHTRNRKRTGFPFAFASMNLFGLGAFILGKSAQEVGWFPALLVARTTMAAVLLLALIPRRRWRSSTSRYAGLVLAGISGAATVGLLDVFGDWMYTRGSELGLVSVTATLSSISTLIVVAGGLLLFDERPAVIQGVGVLLIVTGLVLLGGG